MLTVFALLSKRSTGESRIKGALLSAMVARDIVSKAVGYEKGSSWPLNYFIASIWVSNNYTALEALNYKLSALFFGYGVSGYAEAARFYFGKAESELGVSEIITLIALTKAPSFYSPYCRAERLNQRAEYLAAQLAAYKPRLYHEPYKLPKFKMHSEIVCESAN
jgi:hypothetical protein